MVYVQFLCPSSFVLLIWCITAPCAMSQKTTSPCQSPVRHTLPQVDRHCKIEIVWVLFRYQNRKTLVLTSTSSTWALRVYFSFFSFKFQTRRALRKEPFITDRIVCPSRGDGYEKHPLVSVCTDYVIFIYKAKRFNRRPAMERIQQLASCDIVDFQAAIRQRYSTDVALEF